MTIARAKLHGLHHAAAAAWTRRAVGPVAWVVLEAVCERADRDGDRTVSRCSVRGLAAELGLANDTVARALRRLADSGLLCHESGRAERGRSGGAVT